jgi:IstB-like ATP binding protein
MKSIVYVREVGASVLAPAHCIGRAQRARRKAASAGEENAIAGHSFASWEAFEAHIATWEHELANLRTHGTTGAVPIVRFERDEAHRLKPLGGGSRSDCCAATCPHDAGSLGENVLLLGGPGVGKTHGSIALGRDAIQTGYTVPFTTATTLGAGLAKAHGERRLDEKLLALSKPKLLIVDELGYLPLEPDAAHLFLQLVSRRYETGTMLITSNRGVAVFADPVVTEGSLCGPRCGSAVRDGAARPLRFGAAAKTLSLTFGLPRAATALADSLSHGENSGSSP